MRKHNLQRRIFLPLLGMLFLIPGGIQAQEYNPAYSIVIKGGHVIDPKNDIDKVLDVAIKEGKIALVAKDIDAAQALQVVDAGGMYVTPGLIDIHGHVFAGTEPDHYLSNGFVAVPPDGFTFRNGITTIVDCGGAGWRNFPLFKKNIIENSATRVLSFLNIVGNGMRGGAYEQDTSDMDAKLTARVARRYRNHVVGFKVAHYEDEDWIPVDRAVKAGEMTSMPVIIDFGGDDSHKPLSIEELFFDHLRPGDIYTHAFTELDRREPIVDVETRQLKPFVVRAQQRGIIFDVGFGGASFDFGQALPALKKGFYPNTLSTDLHIGSMNSAMKDLLNIMSRFVAMGMTVSEVVKASTWSPARAIQREELGHLTEGAVADLAVFSMREGEFGFWDRKGYKITGDKKFECEMTIREGRIVYDLNGIADPIVVKKQDAL